MVQSHSAPKDGPGVSPDAPPPLPSKRKASSAAMAQVPKSETYQVDTTDILFIVSGAFVGLDKIIRNRMSKGVSSFPLIFRIC